MKLSLLITSFIFLALNASAQNAGKISGSITGSNQKAIEGATISLLRGKDSSTLKLAIANKEGQFAFEKVVDGKYLVSVTAVGHPKKYSNSIDINAGQQVVQIPVINLTPVAKTMADVAVTTKRALVEQRIDRTIVNVDASITNIGTSALEVLEKSPGVSVDREGNISLKGKEGVLIMVDGRPTQLGRADLANMLRNMSSNQLDQIEIMTNPPARYDAAGTSGIINIKTKKTSTAGYNGSATVGFSQGRYPKTNEGFNFNYREGKVNLFGNLSHNYIKQYGTIKINRNIFNSNTNSLDKIFNQESNRISEGNSYSAKVGMDFFATSKTTFGAAININRRQRSANNPNITNISNASKTLESITSAHVNNEIEWNGLSTNLNFRTVLDKKGKEITADVDFLKYGSQNDLFMVNSYTDATGNPYRKADSLKGDLPQDIQVYTARIDYLHPMKKNARFEAGIKTGVVRTDNNASYDSIQYGNIIHDFNRSNHFVYEENINAAYVNLSTPLSKKLSAQFGLRLENTNAIGKQLTTGENFKRHYTQLFPTAYFQYKANEKNNFGANFGRRVRRPSYESLNPFIKFIDKYVYQKGNPNLKPSVSNVFEISHTWKNQITTTLNYSYVKDVVDEIFEQRGQETFTTPANISSLTQFGLSVNANTQINKWWTSTIYINAFNNNYKGVVTSTPIDLGSTSFMISATQQFKINKTLTAELNGRARNGWYEGVMRAKPIAFMGAGISQQVLKGQGTLRFSVRDIFHSQKFRGRSQYGNVDFEINQTNESRVASIAFSYRFAKGKKIAPVKRTQGSANDEQERIGN